MPRKRNPAKPVSKARTAYELLEEIRQIILEEPKRYDQRCILLCGSECKEAGRAMPACKTVGCVAGWIVALTRRDFVSVGNICGAAREILGLDADQTPQLFYYKAAGGAGQSIGHARRGAAHIRRFMKAHAKQLKAKKV